MPATAITLILVQHTVQQQVIMTVVSTDFYSDTAKADGYYGYADGFHCKLARY